MKQRAPMPERDTMQRQASTHAGAVEAPDDSPRQRQQGERIAQLRSAQAVAQRMPAGPVVQRVKYIRKSGRVVEVADDYQKKAKERWATEEEFARGRGGDAAMDARRQAILERIEAEERRVATERRKQERKARRDRVTPRQMPEAHEGKQIRFPAVVGSADDRPADLVYRGMSVNNVRNLQRGDGAVFTAQSPTGAATPLAHVVDDSEASPFLSFEAEGLGISAGKYAPKPVDPLTHKPLGVTRKDDGFLKQEKSYTAESRRRHPNAKRIGYVGGVTRDAGTQRVDVSDERKAQRVFGATPGESAERKQKAVDLAKADKEVLVKPGPGGIAPAQVPFVSKVKEVNEAYYRKHVARQTPSKALGYYKGHGDTPTYVKMQIAADRDAYKFNVPADLQRADDDSEAEMSDIEEIDLADYASDGD